MNNLILQNLYLIFLLPLGVSCLILAGRSLNILKSKKLTLIITLLSTFIGILLSSFAMYECIKIPSFVFENSFVWLNLADYNLTVNLGILIDNLSALMCFVITVVSFIIQLFSYGYMLKDEGFHRYFVLMNFFNFAMLGLVLSSNLIQTYLFWELVGVASYLLIGFWYQKKSASNAARKAFLVNRTGDVGLLLGIFTLIYYAYNFDITQGLGLLSFVNTDFWANAIRGLSNEVTFYILTICLLMGSVAKSAQFPLHVWLEDAMQGPTPVSALIHAATMVAAGIFLIARLYPLYSLSDYTMTTIMVIGIFTAFFAALVAIEQDDIKKILAFSTCSQLGLMFFAMGAGCYTGGMLHLVTHAYFKALLFLSVGMILACISHKQDIRLLGGLRKIFPLSAITFLLGAISISGLGFGGFISKENIYEYIYFNYPLWLFCGLILLTFLTSVYIFRAYLGIFEGKSRSLIVKTPPHITMTAGISILGMLVIVTGFGIFNHFKDFIFIDFGTAPLYEHSLVIPICSFAAGLLGGLYSFIRYKKDEFSYDERKMSFFKKLLFNKFYINEFYTFINKRILSGIAYIIVFIDKVFIDGAVTLVADFIKFKSRILVKIQNGNIQTYLTTALGICSMLLLIFVFVYYQMMKV